ARCTGSTAPFVLCTDNGRFHREKPPVLSHRTGVYCPALIGDLLFLVQASLLGLRGRRSPEPCLIVSSGARWSSPTSTPAGSLHAVPLFVAASGRPAARPRRACRGAAEENRALGVPRGRVRGRRCAAARVLSARAARTRLQRGGEPVD